MIMQNRKKKGGEREMKKLEIVEQTDCHHPECNCRGRSRSSRSRSSRSRGH